VSEPAAISVEHVTKRFRIPMDRSSTLKYRLTHPRSTSRYHDFDAVSDVSFDVAPGEFVGVIGHNGCGKSTLLKMLADIYRPTAGRIVVRGQVSPFLELGVGFNPELTARENIFLSGAVLGITRAELRRRVDEILAFAELEHAAEQKVKTFSSGMEVRLAFSVAIQANAAILLMDEVLAVGDARFQAKCFEVFARYKRDGRTVVLVTHDTSAVELYCDRALLLDHGHLLSDGPAAEVTSLYRRMVGERVDADAMGARSRLDDDVAAGVPTSQRWGTGEVQITKVALVGADGSEHNSLTSDQPATVQIELAVHQQVDDLICGISIHRADGYTLAGTNTFISNLPLVCPPAGESFEIEYDIPKLNLLGGHYRLTCAVHSKFGKRVYDQLDQVYEFDVTDESGRIGLFDLGGTWSRSEHHVDHRSTSAQAQPERTTGDLTGPAPRAERSPH
jgi:lipopolysaccharide transport system ATP-binding protein